MWALVISRKIWELLKISEGTEEPQISRLQSWPANKKKEDLQDSMKDATEFLFIGQGVEMTIFPRISIASK